jgi:hypothetical protein
MKLEKNTFYVIEDFKGGDDYDGIPRNIIVWTGEHGFDNVHESQIVKSATEKQKEYFMWSMDEPFIDADYCAVSLCDFDDWEKGLLI